MMFFTRRTSWPSEPNTLSRQIAMYRHDNTPFIDLTVSNPTQCGFEYLTADLLKPFSDPANLQYEPNAHGLAAAREAICKYYASKGIAVSPSRIFITAGTSEAYSFIFRLICEPGDALMAPQPSYPLLEYLAGLSDVRVERYQLDPSKKWAVDLKGHYEMKDTEAKALLIVNPNNPTGNYVPDPELAEINLFCKRRSMAIISDEVFLDYNLDENQKGSSCLTNKHNLTFVLSGISKILGIPQMKLSWIAVSGPDPVADEAARRLEVISDTYLSASTPAQRALPAWFALQPIIQKEILDRIRNNHKYLQQKLSGTSIRLYPAAGGWHVPILLSSEQTDEEWACQLMKKDQILTHPGYLFDFQEGSSYLVLSLIAPEVQFKEGVEKIVKRVAAGL